MAKTKIKVTAATVGQHYAALHARIVDLAKAGIANVSQADLLALERAAREIKTIALKVKK